MASNFRISARRNKHNLRLKLRGDFDGTSCHELINTIKNKGRHYKIIVIDTGNLGNIYPFGLTIWEKNLSGIKNTRLRLIIIRAHQDQLSP